MYKSVGTYLYSEDENKDVIVETNDNITTNAPVFLEKKELGVKTDDYLIESSRHVLKNIVRKLKKQPSEKTN